MVRSVGHLGGGADLHDPTLVEHGDPIGDVAHHAQVVGDEHVGHPGSVLEVDEEVQDGGLDTYVERGRRFRLWLREDIEAFRVRHPRRTVQDPSGS